MISVVMGNGSNNSTTALGETLNKVKAKQIIALSGHTSGGQEGEKLDHVENGENEKVEGWKHGPVLMRTDPKSPNAKLLFLFGSQQADGVCAFLSLHIHQPLVFHWRGF